MSCYIGATETTADTVAFSAPLETPCDDGTGTSALTELCRMVNDRLVALHQTAHTFTSVGSTAADGAFVARAYASNPARHPIYEFANVLSECKAQVYLMLNPQVITPAIFGGMVNSSGYRWRYNNAATVKATLDGALAGLLATLVEDWKPMIVALRAALVSLSGAQIQSQPWSAATITIYHTIGSLGRGAGVASLQTSTFGELNPASITPSIGGSSSTWSVDTSAGANQYGDRSPTGFGYDELSGDSRLGVGFHSDGSYPPSSSVDYAGASIPFEDVYGMSEMGWVHAMSHRKTYTLSCSAPLGVDLRKLNGKTIFWHMDTQQDGHLIGYPSPLSVTYSAASGTVTWSGNLISTAATKTVVVDADLDLPAIDITEDARDWWDEYELCETVLVIDTTEFNFCIDSNGNYHDD